MGQRDIIASVVLAVSLAIPIYTYFGYLLVLVVARLFRKPRSIRDLPDRDLPSVTMVVAAHNEAAVIGAKVRNFLDIDYPEDRLQLLIGSDGSDDRTVEFARDAAAATRRVQVVRLEVRRGKASVINDLVFAAIAVLFLWAMPERLERRSLLRLLHRLRSLAHVIDMHQLSKDPEQVSPNYEPTEESIRHGLDADQLHHYLAYCSEMLSLTAKTAALCGEHTADSVVLDTISTIETLTTELSNKIWQKISLLPRD